MTTLRARCLIPLSLLLTLAGGVMADELADGLATISADDVENYLKFFTSDECAGRDTPQKGMLTACDYVAKQFADAGLEPMGDDGKFLLRYGLACADAATSSSLVLTSPQEGELVCTLRDDFIPVRNSLEGSVTGDVVFVGYGISEGKYRWDDYKGVDVRGKIVLVLPSEPRADSKEKKFFDGLEMTESSSLRVKADVAKDKGAIGMLVCAATEEEGQLWLNCQYPIYQRGGQSIALPAAVISSGMADKLMGRSLADVRDGIDRSKSRDSFPVDGALVKLTVRLDQPSLPVPNVVARYRGSQESEEVIVIGAHVDHIGVDDRGRIYRGADDNAGGVSALIEVAQAFAAGKPELKRSILFVAFTGEEKGLLGSAAFVDKPPVPVENIYAMINMDIIARGRKRELEATLPPKKSVLESLLKRAVKTSKCGLKVGDGGKQFFERSDHFEFHKKGIPTVFFNEGETNEDYHLWTDTIDKALSDKVARVGRLAFGLAYLTANSEQSGGFK